MLKNTVKKTEDISTKVREKSRKRARRWGTTWTSWITDREQEVDIKHFSSFSTWFNPNCFSVIISEEKRGKHRLGLWIYEETSREEKIDEKDIHFIKMFTVFSIGEAKRKSDLIEKKLLGEDEVYKNHPILALLEWGDKSIYFSDIVKKARVAKSNALTNSDVYIKEHDVIGIRINNTTTYHIAVYLGNNQVAHIRGLANVPSEQWKAQQDSISEFLKSRESDEVILNRLIIPFKKPELIREHIRKAIAAKYGEGKYNVVSNNCEHFATLCVTGVKFSSQVENPFNFNFRLDKEKIKEETLSNNNFIAQIQV